MDLFLLDIVAVRLLLTAVNTVEQQFYSCSCQSKDAYNLLSERRLNITVSGSEDDPNFMKAKSLAKCVGVDSS